MCQTSPDHQANLMTIHSQSGDECPHCENLYAPWYVGLPGATRRFAGEQGVVSACPLCNRFDNDAEAQEVYDSLIPLIIFGQGDSRRDVPADMPSARRYIMAIIAFAAAVALVGVALAIFGK